MKINFQNHNTFTSRTPQIRDAQWVCHTVNTVLSHKSTTKFLPMYRKTLLKSKWINANREIKSITDVAKILHNSILRDEDLKFFSIHKKLQYKFKKLFMTDKDKKGLDKLIAIQNHIRSIAIARYNCEGEAPTVLQALKLLKDFQLGNCLEDGLLAELILRINGIKNAKTVNIIDSRNPKEPLDHVLCIFNRDGSEFDGKVTKDTIIIDPWCDKADFASNMKLFYNNVMQNHLELPPMEFMQFSGFKCSDSVDSILEELKEYFPQFIYPNKNRRFME